MKYLNLLLALLPGIMAAVTAYIVIITDSSDKVFDKLTGTPVRRGIIKARIQRTLFVLLLIILVQLLYRNLRLVV